MKCRIPMVEAEIADDLTHRGHDLPSTRPTSLKGFSVGFRV